MKIFAKTFVYAVLATFLSLTGAAQRDTLVLRNNRRYVGKTLSIGPRRIEFLKNEKAKPVFVKRHYVYKIIYENSDVQMVNNYYYIEKNRSVAEYRKNLLPVRLLPGHIEYGNHRIGQIKFLKTTKLLGDKELDKTRRRFITLDVLDKFAMISGGMALVHGWLIYLDTQEAKKHDYPWFDKSRYKTAAALAIAGVPVALTGVILIQIKRKVMRPRLISRYNAVLNTSSP